jgi:hypothetical protein
MLLGAVGCASSASERAGAVTPAQGAASELSGEWSEYWSPAGEAETQRYTFSDNGEFRWAAAPSVSAPASGTPLFKRGSFELRRSEQQRWLVLHVAATELAGCDSACEATDTAFKIEHAPALIEEIELSECPPNVEAQHIDAQYACVALGDRAFWRKSPAVKAN